MYGTSFTEPVGKLVLENVFSGDYRKMHHYAVEYRAGERGPHDLGIVFRKIVGTKNRTSWWSGAKRWLEENYHDLLLPPSNRPTDRTETKIETSSNFTYPTGIKVLEVIFKGNKNEMLLYANEYKDGIGGPYDLGLDFREIVKNKNRTDWWRGARKWLETSINI